MTDQTQQAAASIYVVRDMEGRIVDAHDSEPDMTAYHGSCALYVYPAAPAVGAAVASSRNHIMSDAVLLRTIAKSASNVSYEARAQLMAIAASLAPPAASLREQEADMFWDADDTERFAHSLHDIVIERDSDAGLSVGDEIQVQRAHRLPNVTLRVTAVPDEEGQGDYDWEEIDAQRLGREKGEAS
jgi:hypothetical protein